MKSLNLCAMAIIAFTVSAAHAQSQQQSQNDSVVIINGQTYKPVYGVNAPTDARDIKIVVSVSIPVPAPAAQCPVYGYPPVTRPAPAQCPAYGYPPVTYSAPQQIIISPVQTYQPYNYLPPIYGGPRMGIHRYRR